MNEFEKKILKFGLALVGIYILNVLATTLLPIINVHQFKNVDLILKIMWSAPKITINLLFGILLFFDCRNETLNYILISILGVLTPIVGLMFYFIEKFLLPKIQDHAK